MSSTRFAPVNACDNIDGTTEDEAEGRPARMEELLLVAIEAVRKAGQILREELGKERVITHKGVIDLVTDVDRRSEAAIVEVIRAAFPDHAVVGEEGGEIAGAPGRGGYTWLIDPLDGTTNYTHGFPCFCVSVGVACEGVPVAGAIYDPTREELFTALRGEGAYFNGHRLRVSTVKDLDDALLATGFPADLRETRMNLDHFTNFCLVAQAVRRPGSAALDIAYVAAGRLDGFWELRLSPWDMAAGALMVEEAGGRLSEVDGSPFTVFGKGIVASNGLIHDVILSVLRGRR